MDLTPNTRLTLVNAIYMKAQWEAPFNEDGTKPAPFTRLDGSRVDVPTMQRWGGTELPYATGNGWQATELLYLGPPNAPRLAMLLVRPDDLRAFETGLTAEKLAAITTAIAEERQRQRDGIDCPGVPPEQQEAGCYPYALTLHMPRFSTETRAKLNEVLKALGMPLAFEPGSADFSGINPRDPIYISFVIHQANIDVDEKGTEAAAATAVGGDVGGGPSPAKEITLRLDRPFLFFVRDVETGAVLFMGRIVDPSDVRAN
jgi:serpin B